MPQINTAKREMFEVINISGGPVRFEIARGMGEAPDEYELAADEIVALDANYVRQFRIAAGRDPRPSTIDQLTNGKVISITDPRAAAAVDRTRPKAAEKVADPKAAKKVG